MMISKNEWFICQRCGTSVPGAQKTCRNHCPFCFLSVHVDKDVPGDRRSACQAWMVPTARKTDHGRIKIAFTCVVCRKLHRNKAALDDDVAELENRIVRSCSLLEQ